ncbi:MAG: helix-turn-helix domain-containing protein [Spartobacteria bacterium]|nr:helix-turn-helix domain-containing protein [Spartobacteria bacterium]
MSHVIFTVEEVARYLHLELQELNELVRSYEIPFEKQGDRISFRRVDIDKWASQRIIGLENGRLEQYHSQGVKRVEAYHSVVDYRVGELIMATSVCSMIDARTSPSLIRNIVDLADKTGLVIDKADLLHSVQERERLGSTALTGGYAVLHTQHHDPYLFEESFLCIARTSAPIPFRSLDGQTTDIFFLLCCQDDRLHLHTLARLCLMARCTPLIYDLRDAADEKEMIQAMHSAEEVVLKKQPVSRMRKTK